MMTHHQNQQPALHLQRRTPQYQYLALSVMRLQQCHLLTTNILTLEVTSSDPRSSSGFTACHPVPFTGSPHTATQGLFDFTHFHHNYICKSWKMLNYGNFSLSILM